MTEKEAIEIAMDLQERLGDHSEYFEEEGYCDDYEAIKTKEDVSMVYAAMSKIDVDISVTNDVSQSREQFEYMMKDEIQNEVNNITADNFLDAVKKYSIYLNEQGVKI